MERNFELLKQVLSIPTKTYQEDLMIDFITTWSVVTESKVTVDSVTPLTKTHDSPVVLYSFSDTTEISEVLIDIPLIIFLEGIVFIIAIKLNYVYLTRHCSKFHLFI